MTRAYEVDWVLRPNAARTRQLMNGKPRGTLVLNHDQGMVELQANSVNNAKELFNTNPPYAPQSDQVFRIESVRLKRGFERSRD